MHHYTQSFAGGVEQHTVSIDSPTIFCIPVAAAFVFFLVSVLISWWPLVSVAVLIGTLLLNVKEESVLIFPDVGLGLRSRNFLGFESNRFVDKKKIKQILMVEGLLRQHYMYYLAIVLENKEELVIPFKETLPRLAILIPVYRALKKTEKKDDDDE